MDARNVLLHGSDRLAIAIEQRLIRAGHQVTRLHPDLNHSAELTAHILQSASVLVIAADDDPGNVDLALTARRLRTDLPLVVRLFDEALAAYLQQTLQSLTILSMSALAAPAFVETTVQAIADRKLRGPVNQPGKRKKESALRRFRRPDRVLISAMGGLFAILVFFTVFFANALQLSYLNALYFVFTTITTVGYGDIALRDAPDAVKIAGIVLMFSGAAFLAVLFGLFTDWVVSRRLDIIRGRMWVRGDGHVVIAGSGNIGFRVAQGLRERGHRVVIIERDPDNKNVEALRSSGHHVILADAARADTLRLAKVEDCAAVVCLTDSDAVNFQIALLVRSKSKDVPVVMRVVSPELSAHVSEHGNAVAISPIAIASEEFSARV